MVRCTALTALFVSLLTLAASAVEKTPSDKDRKALQGKWEVVSVTELGKEKKVVGKKFLIFDGDKIKFAAEDKVAKEGTYTVDAGKTPKIIDIKGDAKELPILWIYELKGDDLKLCGSADARPTGFSSTEKDMQVMVSLKRVKN